MDKDFEPIKQELGLASDYGNMNSGGGISWNAKTWDWKEEDVCVAPSAERNKDEVCSRFGKLAFFDCSSVLEIGSGTGQHIEQHAKNYKDVIFHPTELSEAGRRSISARTKDLANVKPSFALDLLEENLDVALTVDVVCACNLFHVAPPEIVEGFARCCAKVKAKKAVIYGAFNRSGKFTCESNEKFDTMLKNGNPKWGLKDVESQMQPTMKKYGFENMDVYDSTANNFILLFWK